MSTPTLTATQVKTKTVSATKFAIAIACLGVAALAAAAIDSWTTERGVVRSTDFTDNEEDTKVFSFNKDIKLPLSTKYSLFD